MNQKIVRMLSFIMVTTCMITLMAACGNEKQNAKEINPDMFKSENEYQFHTTAWGMTVDEVTKLSDCKLEKDSDREPFPEGYAIYKAKADYVLDGKTCNTSFEFLNEGLKDVQLAFSLSDSDDPWMDTQIEKLIQLYGEATDKIENENAEMQLKSTVYKWETGETMLQFTVISKASSAPTVVIALVKK